MADRKLPDNVIYLAEAKMKKRLDKLEAEFQELKMTKEKQKTEGIRIAWENYTVHIRRM